MPVSRKKKKKKRRLTARQRRLAEANQALAYHAADYYAERCPVIRRLPRDDRVGAALLGLSVAAQRFDPRRGVAFSTVAMPWMRHALQREAMHVRVVLRDVPKGWIGMASTMPFGLAPWPDHWPHDSDPDAPSLKGDPTLWRVLYPELVPTARPHTFQHRELLYAAMDEPGDPLHWEALADAVEEQDEDPSRERFASRLLREMIVPGGGRVAPGLVRREESR